MSNTKAVKLILPESNWMLLWFIIVVIAILHWFKWEESALNDYQVVKNDNSRRKITTSGAMDRKEEQLALQRNAYQLKSGEKMINPKTMTGRKIAGADPKRKS